MIIDVSVRPMTIGDLARVMEIENASFPTPWRFEDYASELERGRLCRYLVAETQAGVIGFAGMRLLMEEAHVTSVAVDENYRARGVATTLMRALIQSAADAGCMYMELERRANNTKAQALYHKLGFMRVGCKKGYYDDTGEDAIVMALFPLPPGRPEADAELIYEA